MTPRHLAPGLQKLGLAVLRQALEDAAGTGRAAQAARAWLASEDERVTLWADLAGVSVRQIRDRLAAGAPPAPASEAAQDDEAAAVAVDAQAKRRMADEYDATQERGEVATAGKYDQANVPDENVAVVTVAAVARGEEPSRRRRLDLLAQRRSMVAAMRQPVPAVLLPAADAGGA